MRPSLEKPSSADIATLRRRGRRQRARREQLAVAAQSLCRQIERVDRSMRMFRLLQGDRTIGEERTPARQRTALS